MNTGTRLLFQAVESGDVALTRSLLEKSRSQKERPIHCLNCLIQPHSRDDYNGQTVLHLAAQTGDVELLSCLLDSKFGIDVRQPNRQALVAMQVVGTQCTGSTTKPLRRLRQCRLRLLAARPKVSFMKSVEEHKKTLDNLTVRVVEIVNECSDCREHDTTLFDRTVCGCGEVAVPELAPPNAPIGICPKCFLKD